MRSLAPACACPPAPCPRQACQLHAQAHSCNQQTASMPRGQRDARAATHLKVASAHAVTDAGLALIPMLLLGPCCMMRMCVLLWPTPCVREQGARARSCSCIEALNSTAHGSPKVRRIHPSIGGHKREIRKRALFCPNQRNLQSFILVNNGNAVHRTLPCGSCPTTKHQLHKASSAGACNQQAT